MKWFKRIWQTRKTEKLVAKHKQARAVEVDETSEAIRNAEKVLGNGVTIRILKAINHG